IVCPQCEGHGRMRSIESLSLSIIRVAEEHAMKENTGQVLVQAPVEIANFLLNEKRGALREIEKRHDAPIIIVADEALHTPHYEVTRVRENEMGEETSRPSYQRNTPRKLPVHALTKAQLNIPAPAVTHVKHSQPAPIREEREEAAAPAPSFTAPAPVATVAASGVVGWLKRVFGGSPSETTSSAPTEQTRQRNDRQRSDRGNDRNSGQRRDGRGTQSQGQGRGGNGGQRRDEQRGPKPQNAQPETQAGAPQKTRNEPQQPKQAQQPKQQNQPRQPKPQNDAGQNAGGRPPRQPRNGEAARQSRQENTDAVEASSLPVAGAATAALVLADEHLTSDIATRDIAIPETAASTQSAQAHVTSANDAAESDASDPDAAEGDAGDGTGRRRRGRRGGRRRRRGAGEAGVGNEADGSDDFNDGEQPQVILANGSQPEFDFEDESPASAAFAKPVVTTPSSVPAASPATVAVERPRPARAAASAPPVVAPVAEPAVEASVIEPTLPAEPQPLVSAGSDVEVELPRLPSRIVARDILKSDTVESFDAVKTLTVPDEAAQITPPPVAIVEVPPAPSSKAVEAVKPAPARPAAGNTGSLFFTADADTPSSVTRHLFEPMPTVQAAPVQQAETKVEATELPLLAVNDEVSEDSPDQGDERSA
ncbi:MAG: ribonuclease E/G, partial [Pseudoxanthomonas sp.]